MLEFLVPEAHQRDGAILRSGDRVRVHERDIHGSRTGVIKDFDLGNGQPLGRVKFDECSSPCCAGELKGGAPGGVHTRYDIDLLELLEP